jgi:hypothetical protein
MSQMMDKPKVVTVGLEHITSLADESQDDYLASQLNFDPMFDSLELETWGTYGGKLITYDKIKKKYVEQGLTYSGTYDQFTHCAKEKLTKKKAESPNNAIQFMMQGNNPYSHANEYATQVRLRSGGSRGLRAIFWLNRATSLKLGDIIEWDFPNMKTGENDKVLSGNWLIARMKHVVTPSNYQCQVEVLKDGLG